MGGTERHRQVTPMWLAHHFPEDYDRCAFLAGRHICRRCLVLYPLTFAVMALTFATIPDSTRLDRAVMILLPVPAVIEFLLEQFGVIEYSPRRQVVLTIPLAIALGRGFSIYVNRPTSLLFWGTVVFYGAICMAALIRRTMRR